jgi:hypothetical protein
MSCAIALGVAGALGLAGAFGIPAGQGFLVTSDRYILDTAPPVRGLGIAAPDGIQSATDGYRIPMGTTAPNSGVAPLGGEVCP